MKKIYVTTLMTLTVGVLSAQQLQNAGEAKFGIQEKPNHRVLIQDPNDNAFVDRGSAFWSEDFGNGLAGNNNSTVQTWTTDGPEGSVWKHDFYGTSGCWSGSTPAPAFITAANGFMLFDADSLNCLDATTTPNPTMVNPLITAVAGLITPTIDLSAQPFVMLNLDHAYRYCCNTNLTLYVYVSTDNGASWSTPINVFNGSTPAVNANSTPNPLTTSINISSLTASSATVKIKFEWGGVTHYYWALDDISLSAPQPYDVRLNTSIFYNETKEPVMDVLETPVVPANLVDNVILKGLLDNQGMNIATNTSLNYAVVNGAASPSGSGGSTPMDLAVASSREDSAIWAQSATPETYTVTYTATHDDILLEANSTDNVRTGTIITTASSGTGAQYARDNNIATGSGNWNGAGNGYTMGNSFYINTNTTVYSIDVCFTASTIPGATACLILYEMDPAGASAADILVPVVDQCLSGNDYVISNAHESTATTMNWQRFPVNFSSPSTGYALTAGKTYVAAIRHYSGVEDLVIQTGGASADILATWLFDDTDATWYYMTSRPKIRLGMDANATFFVDGVNVNEEVATNLSLSQNMPNPANETSAIGFSLLESAIISFEVVDVTGKVVYTENMGKKSSGVHNITLNTSEYANGIYYYTMTAGEEKITKKMVVTK